ncbi:MAG: hypothetical protein R6V10_08085 [bacterium]
MLKAENEINLVRVHIAGLFFEVLTSKVDVRRIESLEAGKEEVIALNKAPHTGKDELAGDDFKTEVRP